MLLHKKLKILFINQNPIIIEGLNVVLLRLKKEGFNLEFDIAKNYKIGVVMISRLSRLDNYNIVFLDLTSKFSLFSLKFPEEVFFSKIIEVFPELRLVVFTDLDDSYRTYRILKNLKPYGFLIKNEICCNELLIAIKKIVNNSIYYSNSITSILNANKIHESTINEIDRGILYYISKGISTKSLPKFLPLSLSGIEKRKRYLKYYFNAEGKGDDKLINEARLNRII